MRLVAISAAVFASAITLAANSPTALHATQKPTPVQAQKQTQSNRTNASTQPVEQIITVQPGDYLDGLAATYGTTELRLLEANLQISDPSLIYPGEQLRVPSPDEQLPPRTIPSNVPAAVPTTEPEATAQAIPATASPAPAEPDTTGSVWDSLANCESSGNWAANTGNGFYGGLQFTLSSWQAVGGSGYPNEASRDEQIARAQTLQARQGWGAWPVCSAKIGLS